MALTYAIAIVLPSSLFLFGFWADGGFGILTRLAVMTNQSSKDGLNGKAVLPMVLASDVIPWRP